MPPAPTDLRHTYSNLATAIKLLRDKFDRPAIDNANVNDWIPTSPKKRRLGFLYR